jgi:hypothetical protein
MPERGNESGTGALTRAELVRRGIAGGIGLAALGGLPARGLGLLEAAAATTKPDVHGFITRPDLRPPVVTVVSKAHDTADGYLFLAPASGPGRRGCLIVDDAGEPVYFHPTTPNTAMDFSAGMLRGSPVLTWWEGRYVKGVGKIGDYVVMDASYREIARFPCPNGHRPDFHEVLLTDENTLLVTAYETASADLRAVGGPGNGLVYGGLVQELAVPSGRLLWQWRSLDHVDITETVSDQIGSPFDYFHINAIDVDGDGNLLVSARNTSALYKIDRRTGKVLWRLGGKRSDFSMGPGTPFGFQHDARWLDGGRAISIFDNSPDPGATGKPQSRALVLGLDLRRKQVTLVRDLRHRPPIFAFATGNNQLLPNGNRLVAWGITGWWSEYGPDGSMRLDARLPSKGQNYRVRRFPWVGTPTTRPAFKAYRNGGSARLYASWNGATALAAWQLETGRTPGTLNPAGRYPNRGFETSFAIPPGTRFAAVVALDAGGKPLARSKTASVR